MIALFPRDGSTMTQHMSSWPLDRSVAFLLPEAVPHFALSGYVKTAYPGKWNGWRRVPFLVIQNFAPCPIDSAGAG
jgi:hypothetical protein